MRQRIQNFYKSDQVPATGITLGLGNILRSRLVIAMAWGENRASVARKAIEGPVTDNVPASFLQLHNSARCVLDLSAAEELARLSSSLESVVVRMEFQTHPSRNSVALPMHR